MVGRSGLVRRGEVKRMEAVSRYVLALQMALIWRQLCVCLCMVPL